MTIATGFDLQRYVNDAADEIDSMIGTIYVLPVAFGSLKPQSQLILKRINNWLATGQIVITQAIGAEDTALQAYGASMLKDARALLEQIASGSFLLQGATRVDGDAGTTGPEIVNRDKVSANDIFEYRVMQWHPIPPPPPYGRPAWQPGESAIPGLIPGSN